jgi:hypothetical protein
MYSFLCTGHVSSGAGDASAKDVAEKEKTWVSQKLDVVSEECQNESETDEQDVSIRTEMPSSGNAVRQDSGNKSLDSFSSMGSSLEIISMSMLESNVGLPATKTPAGIDTVANSSSSENNRDKSIIAELMRATAISTAVSDDMLNQEEAKKPSGIEAVKPDAERPVTDGTEMDRTVSEEQQEPGDVASGLLLAATMGVSIAHLSTEEQANAPQQETLIAPADPHPERQEDKSSWEPVTTSDIDQSKEKMEDKKLTEQPVMSDVILKSKAKGEAEAGRPLPVAAEASVPDMPEVGSNQQQPIASELNPQVVDYISVQMNQPSVTESEDIASFVAPTESETLTIVEKSDDQESSPGELPAPTGPIADAKVPSPEVVQPQD